MIKKSRIAIVIPLYNEFDSLNYLFYRVDGVHKILKDDNTEKFIFIDDGSTDKTGDALKKKYGKSDYVDIIHHEKNSGYGAALKTGFKRALEARFDYIITIDADTNYDQFLIPQLIYDFNPNTEDIMAASPWHPECSKKNFPIIRFILSYSMSKLYQLVLHPECQPLTCYSACFRLYKKEVLENINHLSNSFLTNTEIISKALLHGYRVKEVPINVNYRLFGASKMKVFRQIINHFQYMNYLRTHKKERAN